MPSKNRVSIRISGKDYTLVGNESDEYIQKVGLYIDKKMNEIQMRNNSFSTSFAAVLTAINVADDFFKSRESESVIRQENESIKEELESLRSEATRLKEENNILSARNTSLQLELVKREAQLGEVRNSINRENKTFVPGTLNEYDM